MEGRGDSKSRKARGRAQDIPYVVNVSLEDVPEGDQPPEAFAHVFDANGEHLASAAVEKGTASLSIPSEMAGRTIRVVLGPPLAERERSSLSEVLRAKGYEQRVRLDPAKPTFDVKVVDSVWKNWFLCHCTVRGRLVKLLTLPDGTVKELPICHARVTICEVDSIPRLVARLPDDLIRRLRDELVAIIHRPPPPPPPEDGIIPAIPPGGGPGPGPDPTPPFLSQNLSLFAAETRLETFGGQAQPMYASARAVGSELDEARTTFMSSAPTTSTLEIRRALLSSVSLIRFHLCDLLWLHPLFQYKVDCFKTVMVDEDGRFETTISYPCFGDRPDLYFKAEQLHGASWDTIYDPGVACGTYWNYDCGSEVVLNVSDPSAVPCAPSDPVKPPPGVTKWVMPLAVGGTYIWGTPSPFVPLPTAGWVRPDGLTNYGGVVDAPFGAHLGFRHGAASSIPSGAIKYYRWSYRKAGTADWKRMTDAVGRHYVKESPGLLPTFPVYNLGPHSVGGSDALFEFKPPAPPGPEAGDPAGTITYWPTDDFFGDIYTGYLSTKPLPPSVELAAGQYQIKLEIFDPAGVQVMPGGGTFEFIVPNGVLGDGTVTARAVAAGEIDAGGFVFNLHIDNNPCTAAVDAPEIAGSSMTDPCGFLPYDPSSPTPVTLAFHAQHPNGL